MKRIAWLNSDSELLRWDEFVRKHPLGGLCQTSAWRRVLETSFAHIRGKFCAVIDDETGEILAGVPVYTVKSWLLGNRVVSVPFATLSDPLVSSCDELRVLLDPVRRLGEDTSSRYTEIRTFRSASLFSESGMRASHSFIHHFIRLDRPLETIRMTLGRTAVRQRISKAEKLGLEVENAAAWEDMEIFYERLCQTRRRLSLPPIPLRFFRSLWQELMPAGHLTLLLARYRNDVVGGVLVVKWKNTFALEYVGDSGQCRNEGVIQLLYWEAVKCALQDGYELFSFGRTYRGNMGLMRSKSHWGTEKENLCTFFYPETTHKDAEDRTASIPYRLIKALSGHLPGPASGLLGEFCYRHMG